MRVVRSCILLSCLAVGCMPMEKGAVKVNINRKSQKDSSQINSISIVNNQLIISGSHLSGVEKIILKNNSVNETFSIELASDNQLIANTLGNVSLAAETIFDLILSSAAGASTYQVTFTLADGSVTTSKIVDGAVTGSKLGITASRGEFLKFNGTTWVAASVYDAQTYLGTWDASTLVLPTPIGNAGEYYIVSDDATFGTPAIHYRPGDWIISDGISWKKIVYSSGVTSFNTRKGIVSLQPSDYSFLVDSGTHKVTGSKLVDIADINITTLTDGQVLKWDSLTSKWVNGTGGGGVPAITATAPLVYSSGALSISAATTSDAGIMSGSDKAKLDTVPTFPTGDGLLERFSGTFLMRTCSPGQMLVFFSGTGWTCSTTLVMEGGSAQTIGMSRNPTSNTAGNSLTVEASGATSGATDKTGGSLILSGGTSTGTGSSAIEFKTSTPSGSTGTGDNAPSTKMTISGEGNVGIGAATPTASLDIITPAKTAGREKIFQLSVSDAPRDFFSFSNGTTANAQFLPVLFGIKESDNRSGLDIRGGTNISNDTGTNALITFTGVLYPDASADPISTVAFSRIATRPIVQFKNVDANLMTMLANGNLGVGTVTPKASLHVDKLATTGTITSSGTTVTGVGTNFTTGLVVGDTIAVLGQAKVVTAIASNTSLTIATAFSSDFVTATAYSKVGVIFNSGNVGIGTIAPTTPLQVYSIPLTGLDLTTNLNSNQSGLTVSANYNPSGNGEGRITFNKTRGTMAAPLATQSGDQLGQVVFANFDGTTARNAAGIVSFADENTTSTGSGGSLGFKTTTNGGILVSEKMRITNKGNVGIGTTTPGALLHVQRAGTTGTITSSGTAVTGSGTNFTTSLMVGDTLIVAGQSKTITAIASNTSLTVDTTFLSDLVVATGYARVGAIINSGSVGIGTSTPGFQAVKPFNSVLDLVTSTDNDLIGYNMRVSDGANNRRVGFFLDDANGVYGLDGTASSGVPHFVIQVAGAEKFRLTNTGNVGIGTTTPGSRLDLGTGSGGVGYQMTDQQMKIVTSAANSGSQYFYGATQKGFISAQSSGLILDTTSSSTPLNLQTSGGNVGIGISAPTAPLHVVTANTTGSIAIFSAPSSMGCSISATGTSCTSDIRFKENVESVNSFLQLDNILKVRPVHFTWKTDNEHIRQTGFIAQELEKIFPEFVKTDDKGFKQVNYAHFVSVLTSGVQNLYKKWFVHERAIASINQKLEILERENDSLKKENDSLKQGNARIQTRLEAIERKLKIK